jgi:hypothetical protein
MIEEIMVFKTMGKVFDSLKAADEFRVDQIGEFLDPLFNHMQLSPTQKIKFIEFFENPSNRVQLINLLDF